MKFGNNAGKEVVIFSTKPYRDHIESYLSELGYSGLVKRRFEKMAFFLVDPLLLAIWEFVVHEINYLGYILTREGIKHQPKNVQVILAINLPNNVKELGHFLRMVQYYRDMWANHSEMPTPLTDLVGEWGKTKTTKKKKAKKMPWRWDPVHQ